MCGMGYGLSFSIHHDGYHRGGGFCMTITEMWKKNSYLDGGNLVVFQIKGLARVWAVVVLLSV